MMNPMPVCSLQLEIDEVLESGRKLPALFSGHTPRGERYLVRHSPNDGWTGTWMCAPITERALACVRTGQAEVRAAFAHTATGTVEIFTVDPDGRFTESLRLCHDLEDADLPPTGAHLRLYPSGRLRAGIGIALRRAGARSSRRPRWAANLTPGCAHPIVDRQSETSS